MERNIRLLALFNFFTDLILFSSVGIIYFSRIVGSYALGMSLFSIMMVSTAFFQIPTGIFSDKLGRKNTIVVGAFCALIAYIFYALGRNYLLLAIAAIIEGLSSSFFSGNNDAYLHDLLSQNNKEHQFHEYLGKVSSVFQIALAVAAVIGSILANWSFVVLMWASVIPKLICFIISLFLTEPAIRQTPHPNMISLLKKAFMEFVRNKKLRLITFAATIRYAIGESVYTFRSVFVLTLWPLWAVGFSSFLSNIGAATSYYFSGKIINRFSPKKVLIFEIVINRIINLIALIFPTILSPALMGSTSLSYGAGSVATSMLLQQEFTPSERATMGSLVSLLGSLCLAITAIVLGLVADKFGPVKTLIIAHLLLLTPLWFYQKIFSRETKYNENPSN